MTVRPLHDADLPVLREIAARSGYPYPDLRAPIEAVLVVADDDDKPVMAVAAERIVQAYLWADKSQSPVTLFAALRLLREPMSTKLRRKGYNSLECFVPPEIESSFGRRLMRSFGFTKNWSSFCGRF